MSQPLVINDRQTQLKKSQSSDSNTIWMISVDGDTFIVYKKPENATSTTIGRLRGRREFSSEEQEKVVKDWYKNLYLNQGNSSSKAELALTEINDLDLIALSKTGLASREMVVLAKRLDLSGKEMAKLLTLSQRTFHRRKPEELLDQVASERLLMLTKLTDHGFDVFEDQGKFNRWLRRPLRILSNQAPLDILDTSQGIKMVDTILGRIEYGVYS